MAKWTDAARHVWNRLTSAVGRLVRPARPETPAELERRQASAVQQVNAYERVFTQNVSDLARRLAENEITPREFRANMAVEIRFLVTTGAVAAVGGWANLAPDDVKRMDARFQEQLQYLDRWVMELERRGVKPSDAAALAARARLYAGSGRAALYAAFNASVMRGFPELPFMPRDGTTLCLTHCYCGWEWKHVDVERGNADVYWRLDFHAGREEEHCETCLRRAQAFNPLRIRGFQFQNLPADLARLKR